VHSTLDYISISIYHIGVRAGVVCIGAYRKMIAVKMVFARHWGWEGKQHILGVQLSPRPPVATCVVHSDCKN